MTDASASRAGASGSSWDTRSVVQVFNGLGALTVFGVVFGAYGFQFILLEPPCPLCLLIRLGMIAVGFGLALNVLFGPRPLHYGLALLAAMFGALASLRQVMLHIVPGTGSYGDPAFGMHLYTWAFIVFVTITLAIAVVLFFTDQFDAPTGPVPPAVRWMAIVVMAAGLFLAGANVITTLLECGVGACPDDPTTFL